MRHRVSMDEAAMSDVTVKAEVRLLSASESGRIGPIRGSYRPNHNFFGPDDRNMTVGVIDLPDGSELHPGQSMEVTITFMGWPGLADQVYQGREWRIQEGGRLVGFGRVIEVLSP
jgi:elongation factor Tu